MSKVYRVVWNKAKGAWTVASELAKSATKGSAGRSDTVGTVRVFPSVLSGMRVARSGSVKRPLRPVLQMLTLVLPAGGLLLASATVFATCTATGTTVNCKGPAPILNPSYMNNADNLNVTVEKSATVGAGVLSIGTAMTLGGKNLTLSNAGVIDPSILGLLSVLSQGVSMGNGEASTMNVTNSGAIKGTSQLLGLSLNNLDGMALAVDNGVGGVTNVTNSGTIGSSPLLGVTLFPSDAPVVALSGGAQVNMVNTGNITGRVAFETAGKAGVGNTFINGGSISGSVSMGANGTNTFTAVTGSTVAAGSSLGLNVLDVIGIKLGFAATGTVDGGAGGNNTLRLQNSASGSGTGNSGVGTISSGTYTNFQHLGVNSGTWTLNDALTGMQDATLSGGVVVAGNNSVFGTGVLTAAGGALQAGVDGLKLNNDVNLKSGLTVQGNKASTLDGVLSGSGSLIKNDDGQLTLSEANQYTGGTTLNGGTLVVGSADSLGKGTLNALTVGGAGTLDSLGNVTLTNAINLTGDNDLTLAGSHDLSLNGVIAGSGGIIKKGAATLTLNGSNTFTGGTEINSGTLALGADGSLSVAGGLNLSGGTATFDMSASDDQTIGSLSGVGGSKVDLGEHTLTFGDTNKHTFAGVASGTGGIVKQGSGIDTFTGANEFTGGTKILDGTLQLGVGGKLAATGAVDLAGAKAIFDIDPGGNQTIGSLSGVAGSVVTLGNSTLSFGDKVDKTDKTFGGAVSGTGGIVKQGSGTETFTGTNTFTGGTTISAGKLAIGVGGSLAATGAVDLASGATFDISDGGNQTIGGLSGASGSTVELGGNKLTFGDAGNQTFGGALNGTGGIVKEGGGTETLTGKNTFTGGTTINAGTLAIGEGGSLVATGTVNLNGSGATFDISDGGNQTIGGLSGIADTKVTLGNSTLSFGRDEDSQTFGGAVSGTGGLIKKGSGTETLTGTNTFTGGVTVNEGTLAIGTGGSLAASGSVHLEGSKATFDISNGGNQTIGGLSGIADTKVELGGNKLTFGDAGNQTFGGALNGTGGIVKEGGGTETLTGKNTFTGGTTINAGTLAIGEGGALAATGAVNLADKKAGFDISGAKAHQTIGGLSGVSDSTVTLGGYTLFFGDGVDRSFDGVVSGEGGLVKGGSGIATLTGTNTFTGGVTVNEGTLAIGAGGSMAANGTVHLDGAKAIFDISNGGKQTIGGLSGASGSKVELGGNTLTFGSEGNQTFGGAVNGTGSLIKVGSGTETFTGKSTFTGGTTISTGTLALGEGGALAATGAVNLASGASFDISKGKADQTIGGLSGASGSKIELDDNTLTFGDAGNQTFGGALNGTGGIVKEGSGTETLTGKNTFTGEATVNAGTLAMGKGGSLAATGTVNLNASGASFDISGGGNQTIGGLSGLSGSTVTLGDNTLTFGGKGNQTFGGVVSGTGGIAKEGVGTETLTGANTFTGDVVIHEGTLAIGAGGSLVATSAVNLAGHLVGERTVFDIAAGGNQTIGSLSGARDSEVVLGGNTLTFGDSSDQTFVGAISGTGGIVKQGNGTETLTGTNTFTGGTTINAGKLAISADGSLAATGAVHLAKSGTDLDLSGAKVKQTIGGLSGVSGSTVTLGGNTLFFGDEVSHSFDGVVSGTGGLVKGGIGTETLTGKNTFIGGVTVNAGKLAIGAGGSLAASGTVHLDGTGAIFDITQGGNQTIGGLSGIADTMVELGGNKLTFGSEGNQTFGGVVNGTGSLVKVGSGTETFTGKSAFTGGTTISAGKLALGEGGALAATGAVDLASGASFDISGGKADQTIGGLSGASGSTVELGGNKLTFGDAGNQTFGGVLNGTGGIVKDGSGTEKLTGKNTFTGGTTIKAGTLEIGAGGALAATGEVNLTGNGTSLNLTQAGNQTISGLSGVAGSTVALGGHVLTLGDEHNHIFNGAMNGTGGLVKQGSGTETLSGANTFTGGATINEGTLALGAGGSLAATGAVNLAGSGATFDIIQAGNQTIGSLGGDAGSKVALGGNTLTFGNASNQIFDGAVNGTGGLVKQGGGTETMTGTNTFTGGTTVKAGTLAIGAGGSLAATGAVNLADHGAGFDITKGGNQTIGSLSGVDGTKVALGGNTLTFGNEANQTFSGVVNGSGGIVKEGSGTVTLTNANSFTGGTALNAGGLIVGNADALGTGTLSVNGAGALDSTQAINLGNAVALNPGAQITIGGLNDLTLNGVISGAGGLVKNGAANLTVTASNTYSGGTVLNAGVLNVGTDHALGTGPITLNDGRLNLHNFNLEQGGLNSTNPAVRIDLGTGALSITNDGNYAGSITGEGTLAKSGSGTLTLTGDNTYNGVTTINGGTLQLGNGGTSGSITGNVVNNGTLAYNRSNDIAYGGSISGTGSVVKNGGGQLTLNGASSYSGPTIVNGGTLALNNGSIAASKVTVNTGATFSGTGRTAGLVVNTGGTAAMGPLIGTLGVGGDVSFAPGSLYRVKVNPQLQADQINAGGTATLSGGTVQVLPVPGQYAPSNTYTILTADGGVNGVFAGATSNLAFLTPNLRYDAKHVYLGLLRNDRSFPDIAVTTDEKAVAGALEPLGNDNPLYNAVVQLDGANARSAFADLSGEIHASAKGVMLDDSRYLRDAVTSRTRQALAPAAGPLAALAAGAAGAVACDSGQPAAGDADDASAGAMNRGECAANARRAPAVWGQMYGSRGRIGTDGNAASVDRSATGFVLGADGTLNDTWRVGIAGGVGHAAFDNSNSNASDSIDSYHLALYGGAQFGSLGVRLGTAYTWNRVHADRSANFPGFSAASSSSYNAGTTQVFGEVGYALPLGRYAFEPFVGLAYVNLHTSDFTESGGPAALHSASDSQNLTYSTLGVRAATNFELSGAKVLTPRVMLGWRHAFGSVIPTSDMAFAGGSGTFTISGVPLARDSGVVEVGIDLGLGKHVTVGVSYTGQYGSGYRDNAVEGNLLWRF
ncbi:autotransporter-associated beta strand repeat-containing protein [Paraburkholderia bonniea]|uniref:autotransporter-associated beta strand repeat-containing protein n=1 Tax=Paraburkholderia bonniea TaxID=2152891 RepID=UPI00129232E2|nr:autotransporter-associated beta strand repeat-containing protein [Paraburkholderia bonniea]